MKVKRAVLLAVTGWAGLVLRPSGRDAPAFPRVEGAAVSGAVSGVAVLEDFREWAAGFARGERDGREGIRLARERRAVMLALIAGDPRRALELAVPEAVRSGLPEGVRDLLEEPVCGRGHLRVAAALPRQAGAPPRVTRTMEVDGRELEVFTWGRRAAWMSRRDLPFQGVALAGKLAMSGDPEVPEETPEPVAASTAAGKSLLLIRVDFPDKPGQVVSDAALSSLIDDLAGRWRGMSFGRMTWAKAGAGSDMTPTLRLPKPHADYTVFGTLLTAARTAAAKAGYDYLRYDHEIVLTGDKPAVDIAGMAYIGERGAWLAGGSWNAGLASHELGHNFGLNHSGLWVAAGSDPAGAGTNLEYGNPFDPMGSGGSSPAAQFNARQKHYLGWIPAEGTGRVMTDGTTVHRLRAMDHEAAAGVRCLAVDRPGSIQDYWIEYRAAYTANPWMSSGVLINLGPVTLDNARPSLLDFAPGTPGREDCPLLMGRTMADPAAGVYLTPVARGTGADGVPWMDVVVNRGAFPGNRRPLAVLSGWPRNPGVHEPAVFRVTAVDPDGDGLVCFWDWGDGTWTGGTGMEGEHRWTGAGWKTVRCSVSDMKGQTETVSFAVAVGAGAVPAAPVTAAGSGSDWRYREEAPAPDWTAPEFDDRGWGSGPAPLGYGGGESTLLGGGAALPAVWFRKAFPVADRGAIGGIGLRIHGDAAVTLRLNGQVIDTGTPSPGGESPRTVSLPPGGLVNGLNQLAAEVRPSGRDGGLLFDLEVLLYPWESLPPLEIAGSPSGVTLIWPRWAEGWRLQSSAGTGGWNEETAVPAAGGDGFRLTLPRDPRRRYFRLVTP